LNKEGKNGSSVELYNKRDFMLKCRMPRLPGYAGQQVEKPDNLGVWHFYTEISSL